MLNIKKIKVIFYLIPLISAFILSAGFIKKSGSFEDKPRYSPRMKNQFAVLECPVEIKDKTISDLLFEAGIKGVISESTQIFFLDNWNGVEAVPLDLLDERLVETDPRRDGYADKLKAFFVNEKSRRLFIPLSNWRNTSLNNIKTSIKQALGETAFFSIIINAPESTVNIFALTANFLLFFLSLLCAENFLSLFCKDLFSNILNKNRNKLLGAKINLLITAVFLTLIFAYAVLVNISILRIIISLMIFILLTALPDFLFLKKAFEKGHKIFRPLFIRPTIKRLFISAFPKNVVLFLAAAFIFGVLSLFIGERSQDSGFVSRGADSGSYGELVSAEDYKAHIAYQSAFSFKPLFSSGQTKEYMGFTQDKDGFYIPDETNVSSYNTRELPSYPFTEFRY